MANFPYYKIIQKKKKKSHYCKSCIGKRGKKKAKECLLSLDIYIYLKKLPFGYFLKQIQNVLKLFGSDIHMDTA